MAKKKPLPPRRKRMRRAARLQSAKHWLAHYRGKDPIRGYARWFGVDWACAIKELGLLGVTLDPASRQQLMRTMEERAKQKKAAEAARKTARDLDGYGDEWDDNFQYIAGWTAGGAPYGIPWSELPEPDPDEPPSGDDHQCK